MVRHAVSGGHPEQLSDHDEADNAQSGRSRSARSSPPASGLASPHPSGSRKTTACCLAPAYASNFATAVASARSASATLPV